MISLGVIGYFSEYIYKNISNDNKFTMILIIALNTLIYEIFGYLISMWKLSVTGEILSFIKILAIEIFYNIIITIIIYPIIQKASIKLLDIFKNNNLTSKIFIV